MHGFLAWAFGPMGGVKSQLPASFGSLQRTFESFEIEENAPNMKPSDNPWLEYWIMGECGK